MKQCVRCRIELTEDNIYACHLRKGYFICKACTRKENRNYYKEHPKFRRKQKEVAKKWRAEHKDFLRDYMKNYLRNWHKRNPNYYRDYLRKNVLVINRKYTRVQKRDYPPNSCCELCIKPRRRLAYHHWDDAEPQKGIWVCRLCHLLVEAIDDKKLSEKYLELKLQVEKCFKRR